LIQIFSQNKLSRNTENDKLYKEFQISYGSDIKLNTNIDFIYHEPKKLREIEKFFLEFFIFTKQNEEFFYDLNHDLKYIDFSLLAIINEVMTKEKITINSENNKNNKNNKIHNPSNPNNKATLIENILFKINNLYYEIYVNGTEYEKMKIQDDNYSNDIYPNNKYTNYNNLNDTSPNNNNNNRQYINTGNMNHILINNNSDSVTIQTFNANFLQINKELFFKEISKITNNFAYLSMNKFHNINSYFYNCNKNDNTLILSKNEISNPNYGLYNYEHSLDLTNKFSDLSALEDERCNPFYNHTHSNIGINNNNRNNNILNNISASFDVILSSLYPRNVNTDEGYESQMLTTNMIMANINTININNSINEGTHIINNQNNLSLTPIQNGNNLNTTVCMNEKNNNNINLNLVTNNNLNNINTFNFNKIGKIPLSMNSHLNTKSNNYYMNNIINNNLGQNNIACSSRVNTIGSFGKNIQSTKNNSITDKPQISIQNLSSPIRNKLSGNLGNKINNLIPVSSIGKNSNLVFNKNLIQKNYRGSQGPNELGKILKLNLFLNQQNEINCIFFF